MRESAVFVTMDFSGSGAGVQQALDSDNMEQAQLESGKVLKTQKEIEDIVKSVGGKLVFDSMEHLVVWIPYDEELIEGLSDIYTQNFGVDTNIGVGRTAGEACQSTDILEAQSKGNVVVAGVAIKEDLKANQEFYKKTDKGMFDLEISKIIKAALLELSIITTESKVYDIFLKLVTGKKLETIEDLQAFFFRPLEEIKTEIRDVYQHSENKLGSILPADDAKHAPGQGNPVRPRRQRSPYKRLNWLTREEYNDGVDYEKTDVQYIGGNVTTDSQQMSMGGEPGNAIAID